MRVRSSPFAGGGGGGGGVGGGGPGGPGGGSSLPSGGVDDWFDGITATPASPVSAPAPRAVPGGMMPPRPNMNVVPPSVPSAQPWQGHQQQQQHQPWPTTTPHLQQAQVQQQWQVQPPQPQHQQQWASQPMAPSVSAGVPPPAPQAQHQQQQHQGFSHQPGGQFSQQQFFQDGAGAVMGAMGVNAAMAGLVANSMMSKVPQELQGAAGWYASFWAGVQAHFNVSHTFVLRKILLLLCPFVRQASQVDTNACSPTSSQDGLKVDSLEADLYIPLMTYVTYVLAYGIQRGTIGGFKPEVLTATASFALVLLVLEVGLAKVAFYVSGSQVAALDLLSNCGYKYLHVMLMVFLRIVTSSSYVYYPVFFYLSASCAYAVRLFLLHLQQSALRSQYGVQPSPLNNHIISALTVAQFPICWLLTPWGAPAAASVIA